MTRLFTFDTTHHALLAEQLAHDNGYAAEVTPAPAESGALCDLALEYFAEDEAALVQLFRDAAVQFRIYAHPG